MKKILVLLGTITISSSTTPTIIATNTYKKKEIKLQNNKNNSLQTNDLKILNRNKREQFKGQSKIVIKTNGVIYSGGITLSNKLYFGSWDGSVYEYDPVTEQQKIVFTTNGSVWSSGVVLNNKLYIGSHDNNVYEYDPVTEQQKIVITANNLITSSGVVLNNKLYFGSDDHNVYEYDPVTEQQKIVITANNIVSSSGVVFNNNVYFGSWDHNVYEYDPVTEQQKIVIKTKDGINSSGVIFDNKLYIGSWDGSVYEYDPVTEQQKIVITTQGQIHSSGVVLNNKLYFGSDDHNVYEYDFVTKQQKIVITANNFIRSSGVIFDNKLYFGSTDHNVYEYDFVTKQQKIIIKTNNWIDSSGIIFNNKLYFGSADHNVYEYDPNYYNLRKISSNSDNAILNELNYLNQDLNTSQLEIINKTNNLAIVKVKDNLNNDIKLEVHYSINNTQNKVINLNELIKKSIFFEFRDKNTNLKFKEFKNINTNNLQYSNIEIKRNNNLHWYVNFKNICFNKRERINISPIKKTYDIPKCEYNQKTKMIFQIITGISEDGQYNTKNDWTLNMDDENKLWDFVNVNYKDETIIHNLSNEFDFANLTQQEKEMEFIFNEPEDKFELATNEKATITYLVKESKYESTLNLKQKINGKITVTVNTDDNIQKTITLSIKEIMQKLEQYNLLPQEITINKDDSITFNGKAIFSWISENKPELILNTSII